jgi:SAM-dependent methyltransferase
VSDRALSFGAVAAAYERFRPGYPDRLVEEVLTYARIPIRTALEIGAGTGKATRAFAEAGIAVTATDPDAAMLAELRLHLPPAVTTIQAAFEDLPLTHSYDLVFAAAAMHWTKPAHRWSRVAALLNPDGVFACFGAQLQLADPAVDEAARAVRAESLPDDEVPSPDGTPAGSALQWPGTELCQAAQFADVRQLTLGRRLAMSAPDYIGHLSTISSYLQLPEPVRDEVLRRILAVLPAQVDLHADLVLHLATVVSPSTTVSPVPT